MILLIPAGNVVSVKYQTIGGFYLSFKKANKYINSIIPLSVLHCLVPHTSAQHHLT